MTDADWQEVKMVASLLQVSVLTKYIIRAMELMYLFQCADEAQQAFSAEKYPSLANAIPALESLHRKWSGRLTLPKYAQHQDGLEAGCETLKDYYDLTSCSAAPLVSMGMPIFSPYRTGLPLISYSH